MVPGPPAADPVETDGGPGDDAADEPRRRSRRGRPRRSWGQRVLLGVGVLVSFTAIAAAATAGYLAWKWRQVDRTHVALNPLVDGAPANYLIVGSDTRKGGDPTDPHAVDDHKPLADTIMILRIDAKEKQARILSLPRDLWVHLAGTKDSGRINAAYAGGGPQRLIDTLQDELEIPIHHYVEVDFKGFQGMVKAVDGVPMWFDRAMRDRNSGLDILHPGCTTLDGYGALAFARARHLEYFSHGRFVYDGTGDLGRISRQQLFMRRLIDRAKSKGIRNPLKLKKLVDVGTDSVTIDQTLGVGDMLALGKRFADFDSSSLLSYTLPATPRTTSGGAAVLDLDTAAAQPILDLFRSPEDKARIERSAGSSGSSTTEIDAADLKVWVLNATQRQGLAVDAKDALAAEGYEVDHWGNGAELDHPAEAKTIIRYAPGTKGAATMLATRVVGGASIAEDASLDRGQVVLFLGEDFQRIGSGGSVTTVTPAAGSTATTSTTSTPRATTTTVPPSKVVGMVPIDTPPDRTCG